MLQGKELVKTNSSYRPPQLHPFTPIAHPLFLLKIPKIYTTGSKKTM